MNIFISYAHVDEYRVRELVDILRASSHEPWFDHRLTVGRAWETQLLEAIQRCDCFLYALTPESVTSPWCRWEFAQAVHAGKPIVPVLVQARTPLDGILGRIQYADFSNGPDPYSVARLLGGLTTAQVINPADVPLLPAPHAEPERPVEAATPQAALAAQLYTDAYAAYRARDYEEALDLLADCLHVDAHHADAQSLHALVQQRITRSKPRRKSTPAQPSVTDLLPPPFEWVTIPAGQVTLERGGYLKQETSFQMETFELAKYPITNAQYAKFIEAGGYSERRWWTDAGWEAKAQGWVWNSKKSDFEPSSTSWTLPRYWEDERFNGTEQPVVGVSWYEVLAFCRWLQAMTGEGVTLPTEQQWQRAAQSDDGRVYPWGDDWDDTRCNNSVGNNNSNQTTPVHAYEGRGDSPFGAVDLAGNVWEWCMTAYESGSTAPDRTDVRVLRGGSWDGNSTDNFRAAFRYRDRPQVRYGNVGFRCARSR